IPVYQGSEETVNGQQPHAWLPAVPDDDQGRLALFQKNCVQLRTDLRLVENSEDAKRVFADLRKTSGWERVATHHQPVVEDLVGSQGIETLFIEEGAKINELERCSVGVTACDALISQTGSILLTARSAGGRVLSVLPPHHVVVAEIHQLVADLPAAFELFYEKYGTNYPSFSTLITGPSRTGDIERILVLGAHGPKNLTVILIGGLPRLDPSIGSP
ncbi:MAG: LUD domain-containing protein, partial [Verrucomicrobia bacterium]|nr:LUD domain-containing protein [Verrucomicrobiota bacterium]